VESEIARSEYFYSQATGGAYSAQNRTHGLRSRIGPGGIEVFPRATSESGAGAPWKLKLETVGFGYEGDVRPIGESWLANYENRIDRRSGPLSEWYVNDERGIEQGWTIPGPPPGVAGRALRIELAAGELRLRYQGLRTWDATGRELGSRLVATSAGLALELEEEGALYPITVDPVLSGPVWTAEIDQAGADFGLSVSGAGDVNGDGFDDVIVGAQLFDNGQLDEGRAFLYFGQAVLDCNGVDDADDIANGTSQDCNANGIPDECETIGTNYSSSNPNPTGSPADISASGSASSAAGTLTLKASPVPTLPGIFFHGENQVQMALGNGFNCVSGGVKRGTLVFGSGNIASYTYDNSDFKHDLSAHIGTTRNFQFMHRDSLGGGA
jgi:hypothetical protein